MTDRGSGTVVTVASAAGLVGVAWQTDYPASKFAAFGFNESLRAELRSEGSAVKTMVVCPIKLIRECWFPWPGSFRSQPSDRLMDFPGINRTMDHFTGRPGDKLPADPEVEDPAVKDPVETGPKVE